MTVAQLAEHASENTIFTIINDWVKVYYSKNSIESEKRIKYLKVKSFWAKSENNIIVEVYK